MYSQILYTSLLHALAIALLDELLHILLQNVSTMCCCTYIHTYIVKKLTSASQKTTEPEVEMETNLSYSSVTTARQRK